MVYRTTERDEEGRAKTIRVTDDPEATVFGRVDANVTHPYRQTEVVANRMFNEMFLFRDLGHASALAVILFLAVIPIMVINIRNMRQQGIGA